MAILVLEFLAGLILSLMTLRDVVDTAVVPGRTGGALKILRRIIFLTLPIWKRSRRREEGLSTRFAPLALVQAFVVWMLLLTLGFGLMIHALAAEFEPVLPSLPQALFVAGSGLVTVGLSETDATGMARWVVMSSGFCGLAVMTLAVTYLLEVQGAVGSRDTGILKLTTAAGRPPSALGLLERFAALGAAEDIPDALKSGRDWCAAVSQSHASHPSLIYFRSVGTASGWPATLGALMDLALSVELLIDRPAWRGSAVLLRDEGGRMAETLVDMIGLGHPPQPPSRAEVEQLVARLKAAGYPIAPDPGIEAFIEARGRYAGCVSPLADHLGSAETPLTPAAGGGQ